MGKYSKIAVVYGSDSSEWEVSCRSGEFTASRIDNTKYEIYEIFARFGQWHLVAFRKRNAMRVLLPEGARPQVDKTDFAYIMQHGSPGETGLLQGYFEMIGIPFSSCSAFVSAVAFDKFACKSYLRDVDFVKCAPDVFVRAGMDIDAACTEIASTLHFPVFVKPTSGGSSFGITRVTDPARLADAIGFAFSEGPSVIVEQGITGRELTCAVYADDEGVKTLPLIEIVTDNAYFDYDAKYNGNSDEICPAPVDEDVRDRVWETSRKIYHRLGCKGVIRIDYILAEDGLYFLEVNTIPGMTGASLVPKMVRTAGEDITDFLTRIIEHA